MTSLQLDKLLSGHVFGFLFIFARIGAVLMLLPGFGETYVSPRIRMMLALSISFLLLEPMMPMIPPPPADLAGLVGLLGYEIVVGLFFGSLIRLIMSVLETIGFVVALQTGLSNAVVLNPALATQSPLPSAFMSIVGVTLVFVTGLDHYLLRSVLATYQIFPPGAALPAGDMAHSFTQAVSSTFAVGIALAAPFIVVGLLMFVALGVMQLLMPQVQLFLVILPVQIWGGLVLLAITISAMMAVWLHYFDRSIGGFLGR